MNLLRIDSVGGASGDMCLALLADLGADLDTISRQVAKADLGEFGIEVHKAESKGIAGSVVKVTVEEEHHHRYLPDILAIISESGIPDRAKDLASATFRRLAEAEGKVHGIAPEKVHFHEVGALDSIIDILGACSALVMLNIDAVTVGPLPTGTGTVKCAHGVMPVPVPATVELLAGHTVMASGERAELITPTGAALLMEWQAALRPKHDCAMELIRSGYGLGHKELGRPNVIRGMLLSDTELDYLSDECVELQTNLDDITPEQISWLERRLLEKGALDVASEPLSMKKGRQGVLLTILCKPWQAPKLSETVFRESTSLGIRETFKTRRVLKRKIVEVETEYGTVRVKVGLIGDEVVTRSPEYDDCARIAGEKDVPFKSVYESASWAFDKLQ